MPEPAKTYYNNSLLIFGRENSLESAENCILEHLNIKHSWGGGVPCLHNSLGGLHLLFRFSVCSTPGTGHLFVTSHGKMYTNVSTFNGQKHQLAISHRKSAVSNPLVNARRFHQIVRWFHQTVTRFHQTVRWVHQTVSSMEKALVTL